MNSNYNNVREGKIIVVNNFSFIDGRLDHAWNTGRLCLVLYSDDDYDYVLPITHFVKYQYRSMYFYIDEKNFDVFYKSRYKESVLSDKNKQSSKNNMDARGYINLRDVYKLPISFRDEVGKINYKTFKFIKNKFKKIHQTKKVEEFIDRIK